MIHEIVGFPEAANTKKTINLSCRNRAAVCHKMELMKPIKFSARGLLTNETCQC